MTEQILALARTLGPAGVTETEALEPLCRAAGRNWKECFGRA